MRYFLWLSQELAIIAADVQEVLGAVIGLKILMNVNNIVGILLILIVVIAILFMQELGQKIFEFAFFVMIGVLSFTMSVNFFQKGIEFNDFANGFVPSIPNTSVFLSILGSVIMPQNIFLHSSLVQTKKWIEFDKKTFITIYQIETALILFVSFWINAFLVGIFSGPEFKDIEVSIENAGQYLKQFMRQINQQLWALGLIASGIASTTTGALTGQFLMDGIFNMAFSKRVRIFVTRAITVIPCLIILGAVNVASAINFLNIIQLVSLPFVAIPLLKFVVSPRIMQNFTYPKKKLFLIYALSFFLTVSNLYVIIKIMTDF